MSERGGAFDGRGDGRERAPRRFPRALREGLAAKLRDRHISDERVLKAMVEVPRHLFVEAGFEDLAYADRSLSIGHGQTISQPYVVAYMTQMLLRAGGVEQVLEVGTGSGYQTAVLAALASRVFTIERVAALYQRARALLGELGCVNVHFRRGDGAKGWRQFAPYDGIMITAATVEMPPALLDQLAVGGRALAPLGAADETQELTLITRTRHGYSERRLLPVKFVPLVGANGG